MSCCQNWTNVQNIYVVSKPVDVIKVFFSAQWVIDDLSGIGNLGNDPNLTNSLKLDIKPSTVTSAVNELTVDPL